MLKTHSWRTVRLVIARHRARGIGLPRARDHWRPFRGHADELVIVDEQVGVTSW